MPTFKTTDGLSLYFEETGQGVPVLCLPGLTRNARDFDWVAPHLQDVRLIRLDARGRGRSAYATDFHSYSVPREAADVLELLDHLGLETAVILGTSRGGLVAAALAATRPDRLAGVILNDVGPVIEADAIARIMLYVGRAPNARTCAEAAAATKAVLGGQFPTLDDATWTAMAEAQFLETPDGLRLRYDPHLRDALLAQAEAGPPPDLWPMFEALKAMPTGLIRGALSDLLSADTAREMQTRIPGLIFSTVPDRGHAPLLDEPEALDVIRAVLEKL
jgi:pimeloyl-ACP methyl ester carboxylesterase